MTKYNLDVVIQIFTVSCRNIVMFFFATETIPYIETCQLFAVGDNLFLPFNIYHSYLNMNSNIRSLASYRQK